MLCCARHGHGAIIRKQRKRFKISLTHKAAHHIPLRTPEKRVLVHMLDEEAQAQGKGAASLDGKMIDIAMYRMGLETIAKAEGIEKRARQR